jgi:hypothetical protein
VKKIQTLNYIILLLEIIAVPATMIVHQKIISFHEFLFLMLYILIQIAVIVMCKYKPRFTRTVLIIYSVIGIASRIFMCTVFISMLKYMTMQLMPQLIYTLVMMAAMSITTLLLLINSINRNNFA